MRRADPLGLTVSGVRSDRERGVSGCEASGTSGAGLTAAVGGARRAKYRFRSGGMFDVGGLTFRSRESARAMVPAPAS